MSTSGLTQVGVGTPAAAAISDAVANPSTVDVAALQLSYNGATWERFRLPNKANQGSSSAAGSQAIWTPAAGKKFRLQRFLLLVTGDATMAVAARNVLQLLDGATPVGIAVQTWIPAAALNNGGLLFSTGWIDLGQGILSGAANNVLNLNLGTALATGSVHCMVAGTEE